MTPTQIATAPKPKTSISHRTIDPSILYLGTPVVLISTRNSDGTANLAPISSAWWLGTTGVIGMGTRSHTVENLRRERECVLSVPSVDLVTEVNRLALTTGSDPMPGYKDVMGFEHVHDKFVRAGLTEIASEVVLPPRVAECPIQLEGAVSSITEVGDPKDHTAAIEVRIVRTHVHESILAPGHRHHIDPDKWRPLIMNFLEFYGLGAQVHPSRLADVF
jgi:flavin reductase (DIM6/NTAB) family NADH-FMN oxidoreductase RutF